MQIMDFVRMSLAHAGVSNQTCHESVRTCVSVQLLHRQRRVTDCLRGRTDDGSSGRGQYLVCLESSDVSNIAADLAALGFQSALNPGRMIRVPAHSRPHPPHYPAGEHSRCSEQRSSKAL